MKLFSLDWQFACRDVAHKQDLMEYAQSCGVPIAHPVTNHFDDKDLFISYFGPVVGIGSLPRRHDSRPTEIVTEFELRRACEDFAHQGQTPPPVPVKFTRTPVLE